MHQSQWQFPHLTKHKTCISAILEAKLGNTFYNFSIRSKVFIGLIPALGLATFFFFLSPAADQRPTVATVAGCSELLFFLQWKTPGGAARHWLNMQLSYKKFLTMQSCSLFFYFLTCWCYFSTHSSTCRSGWRAVKKYHWSKHEFQTFLWFSLSCQSTCC